MEYVSLCQTLDRVARTGGYDCCPNDILESIIKYTGNIKQKASHVYKIEFQYNIVNERSTGAIYWKEEHFSYWCSKCDKCLVAQWKKHISGRHHQSQIKILEFKK